MEIPFYEHLVGPVLSAYERQGEMKVSELRDRLANELGLPGEERARLLPSGNQGVFDSRVGWAQTYLFKAGLLDRVARGTYRINDAGRSFLSAHPHGFNVEDLKTIDALRQWLDASRRTTRHTTQAGSEKNETRQIETETNLSPVERIEDAYGELRAALVGELLDSLLGVSWQRFEQIVIDVLLALGYGGNRSEAGRAFSTSGDHGVDGVIHEDRLGLSKIYVQAKRYARDRAVSRPDIQSFAGSLLGMGSTLGVFITTSTFTSGAEAYAKSLSNQSVVLVDGTALAGHMIDHGVGVQVISSYRLHRLDADYFEAQ